MLACWYSTPPHNTVTQVLAAQGGQFTSVYDSRVVYPLQQWTYARSGCSSSDNNSSSWPPLWSCLYAYPSANRVSDGRTKGMMKGVS